MDIRATTKLAFLQAALILWTGCASTHDESPLRIRTSTDNIHFIFPYGCNNIPANPPLVCHIGGHKCIYMLITND